MLCDSVHDAGRVNGQPSRLSGALPNRNVRRVAPTAPSLWPADGRRSDVAEFHPDSEHRL